MPSALLAAGQPSLDPDRSQACAASHSADCKARGDAAAKAGNWSAAAEAYSAALAGLSGDGDPQVQGALLANRCLARLRLGEGAAALADARRAAALRPRWGKAHLRLGQALQACGDAAAAAAAFQRAAELYPALEAAAARAAAAAEREASRRCCALVLPARSGPLYDAAVRPQVRQPGAGA